MPESLPLLGEEGPVVIVTGGVAYRLSKLLVGEMRRAMDRGERVDPEVARTVMAIERAGRHYATQRVMRALAAAADGSDGIPQEEPSEITEMLTTSDVAQRLKCSPRNVRSLAERGAIPARRVNRSWVFDPVDVAEYISQRSTNESDPGP